MKKLTFAQKLFIPVLLIIIGLVLFQFLYALQLLRNYSRAKIEDELHRDVQILRHWIDNSHRNLEGRELRKLLKVHASAAPNTRITVVDMAGNIMADSMHDSEISDNIADRPEIKAALRGQKKSSRRYSSLSGKQMFYIAAPLKRKHTVRGVLRVAQPAGPIVPLYKLTIRNLLAGFCFAGLTAVLIALLTARHFSRPLYDIQTGTEKFADGDLKARLPSFSTRELDKLAQNMNQMATFLDDRIQTVKQQRNELEAVFSSMAEGVVAIDTDERISRLNNAAGRILRIRTETASGQTLQACIRNAELQTLIQKTLHSGEQVKGEVAFYEDQIKYIQVKSTVLKNAAGNRIGAVAVLNDISRMRKLENLRKDFVANVSHEIRTPVTSIQGFVETLLDGAIDNKDDAIRFLQIIRRHTNRLNAIIEDLLTLSRVERKDAKQSLTFDFHPLKSILGNAIEVCREKADGKSIDIQLHCPENIYVKVNSTLFEQSIVNMLDNALNYSKQGGVIKITASRSQAELIIAVTDFGAGIAKEHLARIFDRFYRIDKGRSREQGGTGLGLAILKHIAQIHDARISVNSKLNEGSTFKIHFPLSRVRENPADV